MEDISIRGKVQEYDDKPIFNIKVSVYDDETLLTHGFTGEDGTYAITLPATKIVTVRFDTSTSLNNSRAWHPSVVANISAEKDVLLDRRLMGVGMGLTETAAIDALHGYEFAALWIKAEPAANQAAYAETAGARIGMLKLVTPVLRDMEQKLRDYFNNYVPE
jgi:post-segregation antitoxin (ccd killing protein)